MELYVLDMECYVLYMECYILSNIHEISVASESSLHSIMEK